MPFYDVVLVLVLLTTTHRLCGLDGHKLVVALLPADVAEGPVVPGVLGDVADLVHRVVMQQHLRFVGVGGEIELSRHLHRAAPSSV